MSDNKVKLNDDKAEVSIIYPSRMSISLSVPDCFATGNTSVLFSDTINNLGFTVDCHLYFMPNAVNHVGTANFERRRIRSIRYHLTTEATATLVSDIILSRLDNCTVTLSFLAAHNP